MTLKVVHRVPIAKLDRLFFIVIFLCQCPTSAIVYKRFKVLLIVYWLYSAEWQIICRLDT